MFFNYRRLPIALSSFLGVAALTLATSTAQAQTTRNFAVSTGSWDTTANWTPSGVPGTLDTANITSRTAIKTGGTINVAAVNLSGSTLQFATNTSLLSAVNATGSFTSNIILDASASGGTVLTIGSTGSISGRFGISKASGAFSTSTINNGTIASNISGYNANITTAFTNNGTVQMTNGATLGFGASSAVNASGGTISATGGSTLGLAFLINNGTVTQTGGTFTGENLTGSGNYNVNATVTSVNNPLILGGTATYNLSGSTIVGVVRVASTANLTYDTLTASSGASLQISGNRTLSGNLNSTGSRIALDASAGSVLTIGSNATLSGIGEIGTTYNSGNAAVSVVNNGTITNSAAGQYVYITDALTNNGTIQALNGVNLTLKDYTGGSPLNPINASGGIITVSGGGKLALTSARLTNNGVLNQTGGIFDTYYLNGTGTNNLTDVILSDSFVISGASKTYLDGNITSFNPTTITLDNGATLGGNGTLANAITVINNGGNLGPGRSPGTFTINGNYTQGAGGKLFIEIGGTTAGTDYDVFTVGGTATLGGTLTIGFVNGFQPVSGQVFNFFNGTGATIGSFSNIAYQNAPGGSIFSVSQNGGSFQINTVAGAAAAPEPSSLVFLAFAGVPVVGSIGRRRKTE